MSIVADLVETVNSASITDTLNFSTFLTWLRQQPPDRTLQGDGACTLQRYLLDHGFAKPAVGYSDCFIETEAGNLQGATLPPWAVKFVQEIDYATHARRRDAILALVERVLPEVAQ
jgi:hypothetical protein